MAKTTRCKVHEWARYHNDHVRCVNCPARTTQKKLDQLTRARASAQLVRAIRKEGK